MKKRLLSAIFASIALAGASQVQNYALHLDANGSVDCGPLPELDSRTAFVVQLWICPDSWSEGAVLLSRGDRLRISMAEDGTLLYVLGDQSFRQTDIPVGEWSALSLRVSEVGNVFAGGCNLGSSSGPIGGSPDDHLVIGGGYSGLIDEVRIWGRDISDEFDYFSHTTINRWNPNWEDLLVYYKMDQELCDNLVDYKGIYTTGARWNNHGVFSPEGVRRQAVDNPLLPYLTNGAYTANARFYDRAIPRDQYLLSNDLIILGIESHQDGHLSYTTPNNHASLSGALWMADYEGRQGVMSFDGESWLDCGTGIMPEGIGAYTFHAYIYVDEWVPGAYIFRKETDDTTQGFSIRLGEESNHEIIVRVNGNDFYNQRKMRVGQWIHLAIGPNGGSTPGTVFWWLYDGYNIGYGSSKCDNSTDITPMGNSACHGLIGEGFKGKIDEFVIWDRSCSRDNVASYRSGLPMPAIGKAVTADIFSGADTYLKFDDPANPGWDSYSQDNWKRIMESAYDGHRGYRVRISVKSHQGWESTIANAARRRIFATDLAALSEGYDGVELDLEWIYGNQMSLGLLAEEIRKALPEGKTLAVSCHNVAYRFPESKMEFCDMFTFQQYGPQSDHSYYSHFERMNRGFVNYGFPREKIICSYATTTSEGHINGSRTLPIRGVRDGFMDGDFKPDGEIDFGVQEGHTFYFDGPLQTYRRAKYATDNHLGGIFYWDMGNDAPVEHPYNLAKWCSYGLNANVDTLVTNVDVKHFDSSGVRLIGAEPSPGRFSVGYDRTTGTLNIDSHTFVALLSICDYDGRTIRRLAVDNGNTANAGILPRGLYLVTATDTGGRRHEAKLLIN